MRNAVSTFSTNVGKIKARPCFLFPFRSWLGYDGQRQHEQKGECLGVVAGY